MTFPILEFDDAREAIIEPSRAKGPAELPANVLLCFFKDVLEKLESEGRLQVSHIHPTENGPNKLYTLEWSGRTLAVMHPGCGASYSILMEERLIAWGARRILACGGAGVLVADRPVGALMVPETAVRDEGASYHYLPPGEEVALSAAGIECICRTLAAKGYAFSRIKTWTTDGFYRETRKRKERRLAQGCTAVDMECAALAAVALFRGVDFAQILYSGDSLAGPLWDNRGWMEQKALREQVFFLAADALAAWQ